MLKRVCQQQHTFQSTVPPPLLRIMLTYYV